MRAKLRRKSAILPLLLLPACLTACAQPSEMLTDLLMEMQQTEVQTQTALPQTETIPETEKETAAETEIPAVMTTAETTEPPVPEPIQYAVPAMLEIYDYFFASSPSSFSETMQETDWAQVPYFTDSEQLRIYLLSEMEQCRTQIPVIVMRGCRVTDISEVNAQTGCMSIQQERLELEKDGTKLKFVVYTVQYSTGALCLNAERTGDLSQLDAWDLAALQEAKRFLTEELDTSASLLVQEQQIHDYICRRTVYADYPPAEGERESYRMASGVLVDGEANCMGYSDAFWMLASMAGFSVQIDCNDDHMWNLITLEDGVHLVDVTWDDDGLMLPDGTLTHTYRFFNAGMDVAGTEYTLFEDSPTMGIISSCAEHMLETEEYVRYKSVGN